MIRKLAPLLTSLLAILGTCSFAQAQSLDSIAAVVNEEIILQSELDRAVRNVKVQFSGRDVQLPPDNILRNQVLDRLALVKLQVARARENGIRVTDEELNHALNSIAQQNNTNLDGLRQQLANEDIQFSDFRESIRDELFVQHLRQSFAQSRIIVSEGEVDAAISQEDDRTHGGVQYRLAHILINLPDGATAEQISTAESKINGVKNLIDKGELDFAAAAMRYSESPNALEGGDLGWRGADEIPSAFSQLVTTIQPGQTIGPLRGPSGFQLLQLIDTRDTDANTAQTVTEYHVRHILVRIDENQSESQARAKIDTLRARIAGGAEFIEIAKESSEDANSRGQGGDLGWFAADAYGSEFGRQVSVLKPDDVSPVFRSDAGWHVIQLVNTRQTDVSQNSKRAQIREMIGQRKMEEEYNRFLQELRGEAFVDNRIDGSTP